MTCHSFFSQKLRKMAQNLSSAAVVIGALRVKKLVYLIDFIFSHTRSGFPLLYTYLPVGKINEQPYVCRMLAAGQSVTSL